MPFQEPKKKKPQTLLLCMHKSCPTSHKDAKLQFIQLVDGQFQPPCVTIIYLMYISKFSWDTFLFLWFGTCMPVLLSIALTFDKYLFPLEEKQDIQIIHSQPVLQRSQARDCHKKHVQHTPTPKHLDKKMKPNW
jgi:hypothetical protein